MFWADLNFADMESFKENLDDIQTFKGMWPGARIIYFLKEHHEQDIHPVNSWVLTDEHNYRWFVLAAMITHPEKDMIITYRYDPEIQFPSIALFNVQYATQREYSALFKLIHALRQIAAVAPGPSPVVSYDLAASMIDHGTKTYEQVLNMFGEDDKEAARQALRRRGINGPVRNR